MHPIEFFSHIRHDQIVAAIRKAEERSTGQIRVFVSRRKVSDPVAAARRRFVDLDMHRTAGRNAILIFVAPHTQTFAVIGDRGVHERVGESAWQALAGQTGEHFKNERIMPGILFAIERAGQLLAEHFPKANS
ncbi:MAG TPA: TPM domain-containing protein [Tepidisphaeraceae bacterium]|jgi:uncharacterized membrane protein|nr:TPM domain-containing protein [Tepidisphaeraceae bacterium]